MCDYRVTVEIFGKSGNQLYAETIHFQDGRYLCPSDAVWQRYGLKPGIEVHQSYVQMHTLKNIIICISRRDNMDKQ